MSATLTESEVWAEIERIHSGESKPAITSPGGWGYCGHVEFTTTGGWRFVVFNDCDEFDYFEEITAPDGRSIDFKRDMWGGGHVDLMPRLVDYGDTAPLEAWGVP